jgi:hypothetical protein
MTARIDDIIATGEHAVAAYIEIRKQFRGRKRLIITAARGILQARRRYPDDRDFRRWLRASPFGALRRQDRNALISIAKNEKRLAAFFAETGSGHPAAIWERGRRTMGDASASASSKRTLRAENAGETDR